MADTRARYDFRGHVVVVTGGAAGIGADIVQYLHDSGATTIAWDLAPCRNDPAAHSLRVDVTDPASIDAAVRDGVGRYGRIVNIASLAGKEGTPNASAYSAAKAGVIALTKSLGKELAGSGVLANAVAPAAVKTQLLEQMDPSHVETMIAKSPLRRLGEPREVTELVAWLCSASCSFNTGAVFDLSGGRATY
ncbi:SDR family NAD(P)-dependent oxidoreductase [Achromobacter deleyi]|uniref:SDR family NAD(P)-dependent oxidoreductase n=1 Tax=Achromobacter deleyi TaxID=1353891 RepID=UPI003F5CAEBB